MLFLAQELNHLVLNWSVLIINFFTYENRVLQNYFIEKILKQIEKKNHILGENKWRKKNILY